MLKTGGCVGSLGCSPTPLRLTGVVHLSSLWGILEVPPLVTSVVSLLHRDGSYGFHLIIPLLWACQRRPSNDPNHSEGVRKPSRWVWEARSTGSRGMKSDGNLEVMDGWTASVSIPYYLGWWHHSHCYFCHDHIHIRRHPEVAPTFPQFPFGPQMCLSE